MKPRSRRWYYNWYSKIGPDSRSRILIASGLGFLSGGVWESFGPGIGLCGIGLSLLVYEVVAN
jgi:hypothetical protein